jgi:hypothetical protein
VTPRSGNNFYKPLYWQGVWTVKNLFESKIGQRVLIEGNNFTNNWADAQEYSTKSSWRDEHWGPEGNKLYRLSVCH